MIEFVGSHGLYPMKFKPIYQSRMWGGTQMREVLGREVPAGAGPIGESWEVSDREEAQSVVANGSMAGATLRELLQHYGRDLVGRKAKSLERFPLLVKLIDAGDRLSLQVHPDEKACVEIGNGAEPKTEMWYIIAARRGAQILAGLQGRATRLQLISQLNSSDVENLLQIYPSQPGDAYFISSGTLHAIGGGNLILEIQQNSDTTYRVSDWGRLDKSGQPRQLHIEQGMRSINFMNRTSPRIAGVAGTASHNRRFNVVNMCPYFSVSDLRLVSNWNDDTLPSGSFHLVSAVNAPVRVGRVDDGLVVELEAGETALVPAIFGAYVIEPLSDVCSAVVKTTL